MPATTGVSAVPLGRPGVEMQAGVMPGYMLSEGTQPRPHGDLLPQLSALVDPDRWLAIPGLIAGVRMWGPQGDAYVEPYAGYRAHVSEHGSLAVIAYASQGGSTKELATYSATRFGGELAGDAMFAELAPWLTLHAQGAVSATYLAGDGTYCVDASGMGTDCDTDAGAHNTFVTSHVHDTFLAATGTLAVDLGRRPTGTINDVRLGLLGTVGTMPQLRDGMEQKGQLYWSAGLALTLGLGAAR